MMEISEDSLFLSVKEIVRKSREKVFRIANSTLLLAYWQIGKLITEDEQQGKERAEYGKYTLKHLSQRLTLEFVASQYRLYHPIKTNHRPGQNLF